MMMNGIHQQIMLLILTTVVKYSKSFSLSHRHSFCASKKAITNNCYPNHQYHPRMLQYPKFISSSLHHEHQLLSHQRDMVENIYGGDYAGQSATFSSIDGKLIPVPEHFVPSSMVEWGQIPSCFEIIVSEDIVPASSSSNGDIGIDRCTVQVMPEVGCGLDNLDTMKIKEHIPSSIFLDSESIGMFIDGLNVASSYDQDKHRVECIFTKPTNTNKDMDVDDDSRNKNMRIRVGINFFPNKLQIKSPIDVVKERKTSDTSSKGTIADGGGLDARTVNQLVGRENANKPFSDSMGLDWDSIKGGSWIVHDRENPSGKETNRNSSDEKITLSLPENIIISYGGSPFTVEISLVIKNEQNSLRRIVMRREFNLNDVDDSVLSSSVEYFWEEKC